VIPFTSVRFTQPCPTCGRRLEIRASLMGHTVACQHCGAHFTADANYETSQKRCCPKQALMDRVERVLQQTESVPSDC
jgi:hypothetical protein